MNISVIIPTYNGVHQIMNVLESLELQTTQANEVIVVIDGSTDGTAELLNQMQSGLPNLKVIEQENSGRAGVRNRGALEASGDLLLFIDDDIIAPPQWIQEHLKHHENYPDTILTGTLDVQEITSKDDFFHFRMWLHDKWGKNMGYLSNSVLLSDPYLTACNLSLSRKRFDQLSGFDERLTDAEDYDLATRATNLHIPLFISPLSFAYNNDVDNVNCEKYLRRLRSYVSAQETLLKLKPEIYGSTHRYSTPQLSGLKYMIFNALAKRWWIDSVDNKLWKWLPKPIRFKLYDLIITSNGTFFPDKVPLS